MNSTDLANKKYHRIIISSRMAIHVLVKIQEILDKDYGAFSWSSWAYPDQGVHNMIDEIEKLQENSDKYLKLKELLKDTVK